MSKRNAVRAIGKTDIGSLDNARHHVETALTLARSAIVPVGRRNTMDVILRRLLDALHMLDVVKAAADPTSSEQASSGAHPEHH